MVVGLTKPEKLLPVPGVKLASCNAGVYKENRHDLVLMELGENSTCACVFTQNAFCAAPVLLAKKHINKAKVNYCLINSGNANAGTGEKGYDDVLTTCNAVSKITGCSLESVLPFSTGVIGEYLPVENIVNALPELVTRLSDTGWLDCATAIMTTDTLPKGVSKNISIDSNKITITGIAKGSGMIRPNMATMLAFIATDAAVKNDVLARILKSAVDKSFNRICVDGDTSTNDACLLVASGESGLPVINDIESKQAIILSDTITDICIELAQSIVRDGEGASKFITVAVEEGKTESECLQVAYTVATSALVKTAFYASDANWGRILACIGRAGLEHIDLNVVFVYLNDICIIENGARCSAYTEESGQHVMEQSDICLRICLGRGGANETLWTCDLSHDYVSINAEYRT